MKITVNFEMFTDSFVKVNRKNFSYNGLMALYEYLTELELDTGEEIELEPIGFCCEFEEYSTGEEIEEAYGMGIEEIKEKTEVIEFEGGSIVRKF